MTEENLHGPAQFDTGAATAADSASGVPPEVVAPRRSRRILKAAILVALIVAVVAGGVGYSRYRARVAREAVAASLGVVDKHIESALSEMDDARIPRDADSLKQFVNQSADHAAIAVDKANDELDLAEKELEELDDSAAKRKYEEAISALREALESANTTYDASRELATMSEDMVELGTLTQDADRLTLEAIMSVNDREFTAAGDSTKAAAVLYAECISRCEALDASVPGAGVSKLTDILKKKSSAPGIIDELCRYGRARSTSKYNAAVKRYNQTILEASKMEMPDFVDDPYLLMGDVTETLAEFSTRMRRAEKAVAAASDAFEAGEY